MGSLRLFPYEEAQLFAQIYSNQAAGIETSMRRMAESIFDPEMFMTIDARVYANSFQMMAREIVTQEKTLLSMYDHALTQKDD